MTPRRLLAAEHLAPAIAATMMSRAPARGGLSDRGVDTDGRSLYGEQRAGWSAAFASRASVVSGQPPDTVDGWAGYIAVYVARGMLEAGR